MTRSRCSRRITASTTQHVPTTVSTRAGSSPGLCQALGRRLGGEQAEDVLGGVPLERRRRRRDGAAALDDDEVPRLVAAARGRRAASSTAGGSRTGRRGGRRRSRGRSSAGRAPAGRCRQLGGHQRRRPDGDGRVGAGAVERRRGRSTTTSRADASIATVRRRRTSRQLGGDPAPDRVVAAGQVPGVVGVQALDALARAADATRGRGPRRSDGSSASRSAA